MSKPVAGSPVSLTRYKSSKSAATNAMLLSVSFYVIFTTLPATVVYLLYNVFPDGQYLDAACQPVDMARDPTWRRYVVYFTVRKVVEEICLSHYACNFFLFVITGLEFRRELCRWVRCCDSQRSSSQQENGATELSLTTVARPHGALHNADELRTFVDAKAS